MIHFHNYHIKPIRDMIEQGNTEIAVTRTLSRGLKKFNLAAMVGQLCADYTTSNHANDLQMERLADYLYKLNQRYKG